MKPKNIPANLKQTALIELIFIESRFQSNMMASLVYEALRDQPHQLKKLDDMCLNLRKSREETFKQYGLISMDDVDD